MFTTEMENGCPADHGIARATIAKRQMRAAGSYLFVAIDRMTRRTYLEIRKDKSARSVTSHQIQALEQRQKMP